MNQSTFDNKLKVATQKCPIKDLAIELLARGMNEEELNNLIKGETLTPDPVKCKLFNYYRDLRAAVTI